MLRAGLSTTAGHKQEATQSSMVSGKRLGCDVAMQEREIERRRVK